MDSKHAIILILLFPWFQTLQITMDDNEEVQLLNDDGSDATTTQNIMKMFNVFKNMLQKSNSDDE